MLEYLKNHIKEEVEGAIDYYTKAIELKKTHPEWAAKFFTMAGMEVEHANCMTKMFNTMHKPEDVSIDDYSKMQTEVIDVYTMSMSKIETLKKMYWSN